MRAVTTANNLREAIEAVMPAMSKDKTRPSLNCVNLDFRSDGSRATAGDGHWMAVHEIDCYVQDPGSAGVDASFLAKLLVVLDGSKGSVAIVSQRGKVQFAIDGVGTLATASISNCPPYDHVWPKGEPKAQPFMGLGANLLAKLAAAFRQGPGTEPLRLDFYGELDPVVVTAHGRKLKACVMPCRV